MVFFHRSAGTESPKEMKAQQDSKEELEKPLLIVMYKSHDDWRRICSRIYGNIRTKQTYQTRLHKEVALRPRNRNANCQRKRKNPSSYKALVFAEWLRFNSAIFPLLHRSWFQDLQLETTYHNSPLMGRLL